MKSDSLRISRNVNTSPNIEIAGWRDEVANIFCGTGREPVPSASVSTSRKRAPSFVALVADAFKREGLELGRFVPRLEFTAPALK